MTDADTSPEQMQLGELVFDDDEFESDSDGDDIALAVMKSHREYNGVKAKTIQMKAKKTMTKKTMTKKTMTKKFKQRPSCKHVKNEG